MNYDYPLSAEFETRAHRSQVNVSLGGLSGHGMAECKEGNLVLREIVAQPHDFVLVGIDGHIHAPHVVETHGAVHLGLSHRAHRQRLSEIAAKRSFDAV